MSLHVTSHLTPSYTLQTTHGAFKFPLRVSVNILQVSRQFSLSGKGLSADVTWKSRSLTVFLDMAPQTFFRGHRCSTLFNGTNQLRLFRVSVQLEAPAHAGFVFELLLADGTGKVFGGQVGLSMVSPG